MTINLLGDEDHDRPCEHACEAVTVIGSTACHRFCPHARAGGNCGATGESAAAPPPSEPAEPFGIIA